MIVKYGMEVKTITVGEKQEADANNGNGENTEATVAVATLATLAEVASLTWCHSGSSRP